MGPERRLSSLSASQRVGTHPSDRFWLTHMQIGFVTFIGESVAVMGYLFLTPSGSHRVLLKVIVGFWLLFGFLGLLCSRSIAGKKWRTTYSVAWTVVSSIAVGVVALIDGSNSPIILLLFLPLVYAALMFTPSSAALCGITTLLCAFLVTVLEHRSTGQFAEPFMLLAVLVGGAVLSFAASVNRSHIERHEQELMDVVTSLATFDDLTGCVGRRVFRLHVDEQIARARKTDGPIALVMIDVDDFKMVNDTYGHLVGDRVLRAVGHLLSRETRGSDLVGRIGGDEFAILMPNTDPATAAAFGDRIRQSASSITEAPVTLSIGVGGCQRAGDIDAEQLFDDADLSLYSVKRSGRNAVAVHQDPFIV
jgi:diguanylate cyclase (GGDEF)-like protein